MRRTGALLAFRKQGDGAEAREKLAAALECNPHIPAFMLGRKKLPRRLPDQIGFGDESEAVCYAAENIDDWKGTTGALSWAYSENRRGGACAIELTPLGWSKRGLTGPYPPHSSPWT
jgi:hypothetical protein